MAEIVLGIGTSHSPLLAISPRMWLDRGKDDLQRTSIHLVDGRAVPYAVLASESGNRFAPFATQEHFEIQARAAHAALDGLADAIDAARVDLLVVIGDDQDELFSRSHLPAFAVYTGTEIATLPKTELVPDLPDWHRAANVGYLMDSVHRHPGSPAFATQLIEALIDRHIEAGLASEVSNPHERGFGHAFGFVIERLLRRRPVPILPLLLNTYFPPNVPRPGRCWDIGEALAEAIAEFPDGLRVGIVASGGLSHFATDTALDNLVLDALGCSDVEALRAIPAHSLRSGNSEILNWIMAGGALQKLVADPFVYLPVYRTPAGTGIGLGFMTWRPPTNTPNNKQEPRHDH